MARSNLELAVAMGKRMALKRKELGLTQEAVAYMAGITHQQYNKAENGKTCLGSDSLLRIATALKTSADYLLSGHANTGKYWEIIELLDGMTDYQVGLTSQIIRCIAACAFCGVKQQLMRSSAAVKRRNGREYITMISESMVKACAGDKSPH